MKDNKHMELKAYKILAEIRGSMLSTIIREARNKMEYYNPNEPDNVIKLLQHIANPAKWDYCGLLRKEDMKVLEILEFLLDDSMTESRPYKEWKEPDKNN